MYEETQRTPPSHILSVDLFNLVVDIKSKMILQLKTQGWCARAAVAVTSDEVGLITATNLVACKEQQCICFSAPKIVLCDM